MPFVNTHEQKNNREREVQHHLSSRSKAEPEHTRPQAKGKTGSNRAPRPGGAMRRRAGARRESEQARGEEEEEAL
jgi:hypothetical protein